MHIFLLLNILLPILFCFLLTLPPLPPLPPLTSLIIFLAYSLAFSFFSLITLSIFSYFLVLLLVFIIEDLHLIAIFISNVLMISGFFFGLLFDPGRNFFKFYFLIKFWSLLIERWFFAFDLHLLESLMISLSLADD